jgi:hypothetical protein
LASEVFLKPNSGNRQAFLDSWKAVLSEGRRAAVEKYLAFNRVGPYARAARKWLTDKAGDDRTTYTQVSPLLPELAWSTGRSAKLQKFSSNLGVARTLDITAKVEAAENLARDVQPKELLELQGTAIVVAESTASRAGEAIRLPRGEVLEVVGTSAGHIQAIGRRSGESPGAVLVSAPASVESIAVGAPLLELLVDASASGSRSAVDPDPLRAELRKLSSSDRRIGWVSIATPKAASDREQGLLSLQAVHVKKVLKDAGVSEAKISTVEGLRFDERRVRVRIYGF